MNIRKLLVVLLAAALLCGGAIFAQKRPVRNVSARRHPNLATAQRLSQRAYEAVVAAQKANEWDLGGHAQKAKDLLDQVNRELKQAAATSNAEHR